MEDGYQTELELEVIQEVDLYRHSVCRKNPGHKHFIPAQNFQAKYLPEEYRKDTELVDLIKLVSVLTVRLSVKYVSLFRPQHFPGTQKTYPLYYHRGSNIMTVGTGWVYKVVKVTGRDCPCMRCQKSCSPHQKWGKIVVMTSGHVIFDIEEGKRTTCHFFYDSSKTRLQECPSVTEAWVVVNNNSVDSSEVTFIVHNMELLGSLSDIYNKYVLLCEKMRDKYNMSKLDDGLYIDYLKKWKRHCLQQINNVCTKEKECKNDYKSGNLNHAALVGHIYDMQELLQYWKQNVNNVTEELKSFFTKKNTVNRLDSEQCMHVHDRLRHANDISFEMEHGYHQSCSTQVECASKKPNSSCCLLELQKVQSKSNVFICQDFEMTGSMEVNGGQCFNSKHTLTVIVSHPHGASKMVTIGHTVERKDLNDNDVGQYIYTTPTCPGSSGAPVFVLGRRLAFITQPHSGVYIYGKCNVSAGGWDL